MDNLTALRGICNALVNTFYPDTEAMEVVMYNEGISPSALAQQRDVALLICAIRLVRGYVETSHSEQGVSSAIDRKHVNANIAMWCSEYGISAEDYLIGTSSIEDGSHLW